MITALPTVHVRHPPQKLYAVCKTPAHRKLVERYTEITSCDYVFIDSYEQFRYA